MARVMAQGGANNVQRRYPTLHRQRLSAHTTCPVDQLESRAMRSSPSHPKQRGANPRGGGVQGGAMVVRRQALAKAIARIARKDV